MTAFKPLYCLLLHYITFLFNSEKVYIYSANKSIEGCHQYHNQDTEPTPHPQILLCAALYA